MQIKIELNARGNPPDQVATAELHFGPDDGLLSGSKLIGFGIWKRRGHVFQPITDTPHICKFCDLPEHQHARIYNVTFPARQYQINGERRSFALLRPVEHPTAQFPIRDAIIAAYLELGAIEV